MNVRFSRAVTRQLALIDRVLISLGKRAMLENEDFRIDHASAGTYQLIATIERSGANILPCSIYLQGDGLRIDLDHIDEALEWPLRDIEENPKTIQLFLVNLFRCFVLFDTSNRTIIMKLFDMNGHIVEELKIGTVGVFASIRQIEVKQHLFYPIYPSENPPVENLQLLGEHGKLASM
ncbi:hypothetical protein [Paracoccus sp. (in: a-proteobacteria)]|uniref:hypothetical protein n=1 Tax=Paracoccus sp. TaxID=267 RepID=UPI001D561FC2|nr:hypothetical protein [Pyrinomonadaceae bacterium]